LCGRTLAVPPRPRTSKQWWKTHDAGNGCVRRRNHFFDEYVQGTALPSYGIQSTFDNDASGAVVFGLRLTQSNVNEHFRMLVPIYLELADGRTIFLGRARLTGNTTLEQKIALKGTKENRGDRDW
jgi:hypothetical protein